MKYKNILFDLDGTITDSSPGIMNGLNKNESIMVGDRYHDIKGAKLNGIDSIAVTYGYGSLDELNKEEPTYFAADCYGLKSILLTNK